MVTFAPRAVPELFFLPFASVSASVSASASASFDGLAFASGLMMALSCKHGNGNEDADEDEDGRTCEHSVGLLVVACGGLVLFVVLA